MRTLYRKNFLVYFNQFTSIRRTLAFKTFVIISAYTNSAIELARRYDDKSHRVEMIALHVIDINPKFHLFTKYGFHYSEYERKAKEAAQKGIAEWFPKIKEKADQHGLRFRSEVTDSSSASVVGEIIKFAEKEKVDLIVIGTRGQSEFERLLLGSVTSGVTVYAQCSVMIVKV